jgi:sulfur transfer protein SufE
MVQGIVSFICDLYSGRSPSEVLALGDSITNLLGLERLLSLTRKRAVLSTVSFILNLAKAHESTQLVA